MPRKPRGFAVRPGEKAVIRSPIGDDLVFVARGEQTDGALMAADVRVSPGEGPPLHVHTREEEYVWMTEGEMRWKLDDELSATPAGSFVFIPRGVSHTFQNIGEEPARMLVMFAPAGMEGFFDRLAELPAFDLDAFRSAAAEHGTDVVGPPLAESDPL
jgi:quercetin dioxygenase-like cupin family protein